MMKAMTTAVVLLILATGCTSNTTAIDQAAIDAAIANPARSDTERELDSRRKPAEVLAFFGIAPGMDVLDVFAGGGYYTEIMSYLVGPAGSITMYNNDPWNNFVAKQVEKRLEGNRLPNVNRVTLVPAELSTLGRQHDAAIFVLGMHDIYHVDTENGWPKIDVQRFLADISGLIKPGGVLGIIDHNAVSGSDPAVTGLSLHRADPAAIIRDLEAAGFSFEGEIGILANPDDDRTTSVFSEALRWKTDRSVMKFRKK